MTQFTFTENVKKHFQYLIDDYGFSVVDEQLNSEAFGNSLIRFESSSTDIMIVLDRGQVIIDIGPYPATPNYQFSMASMMEFLTPEAEEPAYVFPETWENYDEMIEWQVRRLARVLRQYCSPVLLGRFSEWEELDQRIRKEAREAYRTLKGKDPIVVSSTTKPQ
jgi:hypothetical protein